MISDCFVYKLVDLQCFCHFHGSQLFTCVANWRVDYLCIGKLSPIGETKLRSIESCSNFD